MPRIEPILFALAATLAAGSVVHAADIGNDLRATILLQGLPCDQIAEQSRNADSDYNVTCKNGSHYHVFVNAQGRVQVQRIKS